MIQCLCGSQIEYSRCCGVYHQDKQQAPTPEALMRSRYCAYAMADAGYIKKTMRGKPALGFNEEEAESWALKAVWLGLKIIKTHQESEDKGFVEFIARFSESGRQQSIHEISEFHREEGRWFYVDGVLQDRAKAIKKQQISRNSSCPCGSLKKYKNCHGR